MKPKLTFYWDPPALSKLRAVPQPQALAILQALTRLASTGEGDVSALHGPLAHSLRLRVGDYRVRLCVLAPRQILILDVEHRSKAYR